jgi:putative glycosyltransferase (TIGR04372 family)
MRYIYFFIKQIKDFKKNPKSIRTKFKTLFDLLIKIIFFPLNILIIILIILLKNIFFVRIGFLKTAWVGQMIVTGEIFLLKKKNKTKRSFDILISDKKISNKFVFKKLKEKIIIINHNFFLVYEIMNYLAKKNEYFLKHILFKLEHLADSNQDLDLNDQILKLNQSEINYGYEILKKNIKKKYKGIVLYCVRNNYYYNINHPNTDWNHNNYRDYNFEDFIPSIDYLMAKGFLVIRFGRLNEKEIKINNELFVDYSFCKWKSDFMDFFLGYASSFCITTGTGSDEFPKLFRKRMGIIINPISHVFDRKNWTYIFGNFINIKLNRCLNFRELLDNKLYELEEIYTLDKNFVLKKNTSNDILELVQEVTQKHLNEFDYKKVNFNLQRSFWENYSKISRITYINKKEFRKEENRICNSFLENNKDILGI